MEVARDLYVKRHQAAGTKRGLDVAVQRWIGSKLRASYANQLIELRIALEALYLNNAAGESRYRVSTYGAWHLGRTSSERIKISRALRWAYDKASHAVHARTGDPSAEDREKVKVAQDICRDGILKRLDQTLEPEWNELALGALES